MTQGWSRKALIRTIVTSATYRQASQVRPELLDRDPENRLLARQDRFRVEAEITRDMFLAAGGLLNTAIGGPSVRPPLPEGVRELGYANSIPWPEQKDDSSYRRGIYIHFQRTVPFPMLMTFDCPDSNVTVAQRARSNSPLQALTLLNDPAFVEAAQALALRALSEVQGDDDARIRHAFRLCLGRTPTEAEFERLQALLTDQRAVFEANGDAAIKLAGAQRPENVAPHDAAAYAALGRVIMNLDEFLTRE
jgi:uncharacterized protein DUF1553